MIYRLNFINKLNSVLVKLEFKHRNILIVVNFQRDMTYYNVFILAGNVLMFFWVVVAGNYRINL